MKWRNKNFGLSPFDPDYDDNYNPDEDYDRFCEALEDKADYEREYLKIAIEIIPEENKYGTFINIRQYYKSYIHIYFNDNSQNEIKKYNITKDDKVKKIKIIIDYNVKSLAGFFKNSD